MNLMNIIIQKKKEKENNKINKNNAYFKYLDNNEFMKIMSLDDRMKMAYSSTKKFDKTMSKDTIDKLRKKYFNFPKNKSRPILYVKIKSNNNSTDNINNLSNLNELGINKNNELSFFNRYKCWC